MVSLSFANITKEEILRQLAHWDDNKSHELIIVSTVFFVLSLIFVCLRFVARQKTRIRYRAEDYIIVISLVFAASLWISILMLVKYGAGQHSMRVVHYHGIIYMVRTLQALMALELSYILSHLAIKLSILFLYKTIFTFIVKWFKIAWYAVLAYVIAVTIASIVIILTQCRPIAYTWNEPLGAEGSCLNLRALEIGRGALLAIADVMLLVLPMPILWSLHIQPRKKIMLCALFALGLLSTISSFVRIYFMHKVPSVVDLTYVQTNSLIWTVIEVDLGIVCACFPTLKPLWSRERPETSFKEPSTSWWSRMVSHGTSRDNSKGFPMWSRDKPYNSVGSTTEVTEPSRPNNVVPDRIHTNEPVSIPRDEV